MSRWTMIKWAFRGIAFLLIALLVSAIITLWSQPHASNKASAAPEKLQMEFSAEPVSQQVKKRNAF